jgi:hypothetical protein
MQAWPRRLPGTDPKMLATPSQITDLAMPDGCKRSITTWHCATPAGSEWPDLQESVLMVVAAASFPPRRFLPISSSLWLTAGGKFKQVLTTTG